jgi:putative transposase
MPDHVHALIWFPETGQLSPFMNKWKDQSSIALKALFRTGFPNYWATIDAADPIWQRRYYDFNIWTRQKVEEKLAGTWRASPWACRFSGHLAWKRTMPATRAS